MSERDEETSGMKTDNRGLSPQIGFVLLFGMVIIGVLLLAATGWVLLDSLESESQAEMTRATVEMTNHGIATTASTGQMQTIPWEDAHYQDDGEVYIIWYDDSPEGSSEIVHINPLGAIEYESADRTIAYQSGASWEQYDDGTQVTSAPDVGYEDGVLELYFVKLDQESVSGSEAVVELDQSSDLSERISDATDEAAQNGYNNLTIVVDSKYHDGWYSHLNSSFQENENTTVTPRATDAPVIDGTENTVQVTIENATETEPPEFIVAEDQVLPYTDEHGDAHRFVADTHGDLKINADIENVGDERQTQDVTVSIDNPDIEEAKTLTLAGGEEESINITVPESELDELDFGENYNYTISTEDHEVENSSFYYAKTDSSYLNVSRPQVNGNEADSETDPTTIGSGQENVSIGADVGNIGAENITGSDVSLSLKSLDEDIISAYGEDPYNISDNENPIVNRSYGENGTVVWNTSRTELLETEHEFTITAEETGENVTGYFNVTHAIESGDTEVFTPANSSVNVSVIGTELGYTPRLVCIEPGFFGCNEDGYQVDWIPSFTNIYTQPVDENGDPLDDPERQAGMDWADENLNQWDERLETFDYDFTTDGDNRTSLMVQTTSYLDCDEWQVAGEENRGGTTYQHRSCPTDEEQNELVDLTADTQTEETNVRVLSEEQNTMPELDPGNDVQIPANELLERDGVDIDVTENPDGSADLDLSENEFVFVFEATHHPEQYNYNPELDDPGLSADEYWQEAHDRDGDPNFNDVLVHVDIEPGGDGINPGDTVLFPEVNDGEVPDLGAGNGGEGGASGYDSDDIEIGSDEIIIG
ncbi:hypothetical protein SAMN05444422_103332 [Halobiforma haloterrestris]|uniref:Flagellin n=1 Tax=Natronobacterium haloterrestre TaxID=148448 RepID=A0A1I1FF93_NATHA|nr:hypothetical protein [Halobiforma haloterrestris]SFB98035.1 hypothetical protein SAMN05444422_103332 [Halobiforma haloterrestris]